MSKNSFAESIARIALTLAMVMTGILFLLLSYASGLPDGYAAAGPGEGLFGYRRDTVMFLIIGLPLLIGGIVMHFRTKRQARMESSQ